MFIVEALAESQGAADSAGSPLLSLVPLVLIFVIFFFLVIRPQHKRVKLHNKMLDSLKKEDKVVCSSGIIGVITKIHEKDSLISLEIAKDVEIKITKSSVASVADNFEGLDNSKKAKKHSENKKADGKDLQEKDD